jgi:exosome complex RNA-binding protein Csl4
MKFCSRCKQTRPEADEYCFRCGDFLVVDPRSLRCLVCDREMQRKDIYCAKCGTRRVEV